MTNEAFYVAESGESTIGLIIVVVLAVAILYQFAMRMRERR